VPLMSMLRHRANRGATDIDARLLLSARTLHDVVQFYDVRFALQLTEQDKADLEAFLAAL